ncbi:MFS transporter [Bacillaceae bacterium Marseille-Q3522]|nr:MFS transporter [Bacillaceae bacterium Marseille-Q3522]
MITNVIQEELPVSNKIIIVSIVTALCLVGDSFLYIALPIYWKDAGLTSIWQVGLLLSINRFIRLPANPVIGWFYQRMSLKTGLLIAVVIGSLTTLGYGVVKGFIGWIILRALWGIAWSFFRIGGLSTVVHYADEKNRGKAMGLYNGLYRLGSLVGMLAGGVLVPFFGLSAIAIVFGSISIIGIPLIFVSLKTSDKESKNLSSSKKELQSLHFNRSAFMVIISGFFLTMLIQGVFTSTLSTLIKHHFGVQIPLFGITIGVTALAGLILAARWVWEPFLGSLFGKWSDGSKGRIPLLNVSLFIASITYGLLSVKIPIFIWIAVVLITMISATSLTTLTDSLAGDIAKTTNAVAFLTLYSIIQDVGAAIGPIIAYLLIEKAHGFLYLYWGCSAILLTLSLTWMKEIRYSADSEYSIK